MKKRTFSIKEAFDFGFDTFLSKKCFFIKVFVMMALIIVPFTIASALLPAFNIPSQIIIQILSFFIIIGFIKLALNLYDQKEVQAISILQFFKISKLKQVLKFIVVGILYSLLMFVSFILFIVPGVYFLTKYIFAIYCIVDRDTGIFQSFKCSSKLTCCAKFKILLFLITFGLFNLSGTIPCAILVALSFVTTIPILKFGLLSCGIILLVFWFIFATSVFYLAQAKIFRTLQEQKCTTCKGEM